MQRKWKLFWGFVGLAVVAFALLIFGVFATMSHRYPPSKQIGEIHAENATENEATKAWGR